MESGDYSGDIRTIRSGKCRDSPATILAARTVGQGAGIAHAMGLTHQAVALQPNHQQLVD